MNKEENSFQNFIKNKPLRGKEKIDILNIIFKRERGEFIVRYISPKETIIGSSTISYGDFEDFLNSFEIDLSILSSETASEQEKLVQFKKICNLFCKYGLGSNKLVYKHFSGPVILVLYSFFFNEIIAPKSIKFEKLVAKLWRYAEKLGLDEEFISPAFFKTPIFFAILEEFCIVYGIHISYSFHLPYGDKDLSTKEIGVYFYPQLTSPHYYRLNSEQDSMEENLWFIYESVNKIFYQ